MNGTQGEGGGLGEKKARRAAGKISYGGSCGHVRGARLD